jgi:hypothetical protein
MVDEDEDRRVIRGIVALPILPGIIQPFAADRAEHIAPEDKGAESFSGGAREAIVSTVIFSDHRSKGPGRVEPIVQLSPPLCRAGF